MSQWFPVVPCLFQRQLLSPKRVLAILLILALIILNWHGAKQKTRPQGEAVPSDEEKALKALEAASCSFPPFVPASNDPSRPNFGEFDEDPTARARVGPNPQLDSKANYTVIYNFASPKPVKKLVIAKAEKGKDDYEEDDDEEEEEEEEEVSTDLEHVTLVTHATPEFLYPDLLTLLSHWPGHPVSVSVYAPGEDFCAATAVVSWLWTCREDVRRQASFHVFFPSDFANDIAVKTAADGIRIWDVNCAVKPDFKQGESYRSRRSLAYPVNAARNIARTAANTKYILTSDVELYPSAGLADNFIRFVSSEDADSKLYTGGSQKLVFVVPTFEVAKTETVPSSKRDLLRLYREKKAVYFHKHSCSHCQKFPGIGKWLNQKDLKEEDKSVRVFNVASRAPPNHRWEPIYIGTQDEPLYDERLSWEGFQDKMTQMHELCLLDYRFAILDTAFLVHKPGIKRKRSKTYASKSESWRAPFVEENKRVYVASMKAFRKQYGEDETKCQERYHEREWYKHEDEWYVKRKLPVPDRWD